MCNYTWVLHIVRFTSHTVLQCKLYSSEGESAVLLSAAKGMARHAWSSESSDSAGLGGARVGAGDQAAPLEQPEAVDGQTGQD